MTTLAEAVTKAKTVCTCGHDRTQHMMEMEDKMCSVLFCHCWDFTLPLLQFQQIQSLRPQPESSRKELTKVAI